MYYFPALQPARLVHRYKRFLADVITPQGETLTIHCANTGAMTGCATPGDTVWYSTSDNLARKYSHSWELTQTQEGHWICVNTLCANRLLYEALIADSITPLCGYNRLQTEVRYGQEKSRIDFLLQSEGRRNCYIEVKSVTLLQHGRGYFPDSVSVRGQKHLRELTTLARKGARAVIFFAVMHTAIDSVSPAKHIDDEYAKLLDLAQQNGVELLCYKAQITPTGLTLVHSQKCCCYV